MPNRLLWVRHGESQSNITRDYSPRQSDPPLTPKGVLQAQQTADYLAQREIGELYTSPSRRTIHTAKIIGERLHLVPTVVDNFREVDTGSLDLQASSPENWALCFSIFEDWLSGRADTSFPGGENYHALLRRMSDGFGQIMSGKQDTNIVVVGHGGNFTAVLNSICPDIHPRELFATPNHNCSVTELLISWGDGGLKATLEEWASSAHLYGEAADLDPGFPMR
jgi:broad specificity phosphatase PhoE